MVAITGLMFTRPTISDTPEAAGTISAVQLDNAIRIRKELGFPAEPALVRIMLESGPWSDRGEPFSASEQADLAARADLRDRLEPALAVLRSAPEEYGGHYFDQESGGLVLVVRTLPTSDRVIEAFKGLLPLDAVVKYVPSNYSKAAMVELRDLLFFALPADSSTSAYFDPISGTVHLAVAPEDLDAAVGLLGDNDQVTLTLGSPSVGDACVSRNSCEIPWRGGIYLSGCSWAFTARPTVTSSTRWVLSAGHCSHLGDSRVHDGAVVTTNTGVDRNTFDMSSPVSESMRAPLKTDAGARNLVYISSANMAYAITSKESTGTQDVGDGIAMSGIGSSYVSGTVVAVDLQRTVCRDTTCKTILMMKASFDSKSGDSGAPVISRTLPRAFGLNFGHEASDSRALYSPIDRVLTDMGARLCLDSGCS